MRWAGPAPSRMLRQWGLPALMAILCAAATPRVLGAGELWSLRPPIRPAVPKVRDAGWVRTPVDAFVLAELEKRGLRPAPPTERATLIRRVTFDLIGLPPTPERVLKFVDDPSPTAYETLVDELLASPQYGERWARHWLDAARYADSGGYETDIYYKNAWRYRDYVVQSLNADKPYDRFVREQIAGDELFPSDYSLDGSYVLPAEKKRALEARTATGLYTLGPQIHESNMDGKKIRSEWLTDCADLTGSLFMGLTVGCARCHDHKSDPLTQRDYYALQAVFAPSRDTEVPIVHAMAIASHRQHYPRVLALAAALKALRAFRSRTAGRALTPAEEEERRQLSDRVTNAALEIPENIPDAPGGAWDGFYEPPSITALGHLDPALRQPVRILHRGELSRPGAVVGPALPAVFGSGAEKLPDLSDAQSRRKKLALWLTGPEHPLTARVLVNRVWQWHFGRGLVETPNDFGRMGGAPSHPALLDWLATTFARPSGTAGGLGWSMKKLHRLVVLSNVYRMSSAHRDAAAERADGENKWLWKMNRRRLEGEALWDAVHAVSGTLNLKAGGRPVMPPLSEEEMTALRDRWQWVVPFDASEHRRRGLYLLVRRNFRFPLFETFDAPVNSQSCPRRDVTTVAPQALWFLNNRTSLQRAEEFAARVTRELAAAPPSAGALDRAWIERAWRVALGRAPAAEESRTALELLNEGRRSRATAPSAEGRIALLLFNLNEFAFVD